MKNLKMLITGLILLLMMSSITLGCAAKNPQIDLELACPPFPEPTEYVEGVFDIVSEAEPEFKAYYRELIRLKLRLDICNESFRQN